MELDLAERGRERTIVRCCLLKQALLSYCYELALV